MSEKVDSEKGTEVVSFLQLIKQQIVNFFFSIIF